MTAEKSIEKADLKCLRVSMSTERSGLPVKIVVISTIRDMVLSWHILFVLCSAHTAFINQIFYRIFIDIFVPRVIFIAMVSASLTDAFVGSLLVSVRWIMCWGAKFTAGRNCHKYCC